jgi:hypothetical protein
METSRTLRSELLVGLGLLVLGLLGRYFLVGFGLQPFPNFEVVMVVTFVAMLLVRPWIAFLIPLGCMVGSDILIGNPILIGDQMNRIVLFTYSGFTILAAVSYLLRSRVRPLYSSLSVRTVGLTTGLGVGFVLLYDCWTNLGWWYLLYPHTTSALGLVFSAGALFMLYHVLSALLTFTVVGVPLLWLATHKLSLPVLVPMRRLHAVPVICLVLGLVAVSFTGMAARVPERTDIWLAKADSTSVAVTLQGNGWTVSNRLVAYKGETAFSLLQREATLHHLAVDATFYASYNSWMINSIGPDSGHNMTWWQYYVNGVLGSVGADHCSMTNGQSLVWRFETVPS